MRYALTIVVGCLLMIKATAQEATEQQKTDSVNKRGLSVYRKYSFSLAVAPYTNVTHGGGNYLFGATEVTFCDRFKWLHNPGAEVSMGVAFEPYQGTKLNLGLDYLLLPKSHRTNLYGGVQFSQGLSQSTNTQGNAYVNLGFHSYMTPFLGFIWWPWKPNYVYKAALTSAQNNSNDRFLNPHIQELFYFKLQVGYSVLLNSRVNVDTTGGFTDAHLYQVIRNNTASTLVFRLSIGINIPTFDDRERNKFSQPLRNILPIK
jgi:hypothetical protein